MRGVVLPGVVGGAVGILDHQAVVALGPIVLVRSVVVVAGFADADLEEVRIEEHRGGGGIAPARMAPDAGAIQVDPRILRRQRLHPRDLVGQGVVDHVAVVRVLEGLAAPGRAHAVDGDDYKAEFRQRLVVDLRAGEGARAHRAGLRAGIDVVDDRVLLVRIEVGRLPQHPVQVGLTIACLDRELLRRAPAGGLEARIVYAGDFLDLAAIIQPTNDGDRRTAAGRMGVDEVAAVLCKGDAVLRVFGRQQLDLAAIKGGAVDVLVIGIAVRFTTDAIEPDRAGCFVQLQHFDHVPVACGHRALLLATGEVMQVEVAPVRLLRPPQEFVGFRQVAPVHHAADAALELGLGRFQIDIVDRAAGDIGDAQLRGSVAAIGADEGERLAVICPLHVLPAAAAADIVAGGRAMLVRRHLQTNQPRSLAAEVDDDALDHGDVLVADERILPLLHARCADIGADHGHGAGLALVLLEGGDAAGIR